MGQKRPIPLVNYQGEKKKGRGYSNVWVSSFTALISWFRLFVFCFFVFFIVYMLQRVWGRWFFSRRKSLFIRVWKSNFVGLRLVYLTFVYLCTHLIYQLIGFGIALWIGNLVRVLLMSQHSSICLSCLQESL